MLNRSLPLWMLSSFCLASPVLFAPAASAQANPELGDVRTPPPPPQPVAPVPASEPAPATRRVEHVEHADRYERPAGPFERTVATTGTDHAAMVGHFGVGWFGVMQLPAGGESLTIPTGTMGNNIDAGTLSAPALGARYWLSEGLAIEGALGIGVTSNGVTTRNGNTSTDANGPHLFGMAFHGGLPLVFATSQHFAFELVPELNVGFVTGGQTLAMNDASISGVLLQVGARVGAEIQFGFIGIPELSLQGTVGLHMSYEGRAISVGNMEVSSHRFFFGTTVQGEPWDIFTGNIAAIYYF